MQLGKSPFPYSTRKTTSNSSVSTADTANEPRQPSRLEKNMNMAYSRTIEGGTARPRPSPCRLPVVAHAAARLRQATATHVADREQHDVEPGLVLTEVV